MQAPNETVRWSHTGAGRGKRPTERARPYACRILAPRPPHRFACLLFRGPPQRPATGESTRARCVRRSTPSPFALVSTAPAVRPRSTQRDAIGFRSLGVWWRATRVLSARRDGGAYRGDARDRRPARAHDRPAAAAGGRRDRRAVARSSRPARRRRRDGPGFRRPARRALPRLRRALQRRRPARRRASRTTSPRVPTSRSSSSRVAAFVPLPGYRPRARRDLLPDPLAAVDAAATACSIDHDETQHFRPRDAGRGPWGLDVAAHADLRVLRRPEPGRRAAALHRGRRPPAARRRAPFVFGPWWQPYGRRAAKDRRRCRRAGAAGSVVQTYTHYLPCGDQQGRTAGQRAAHRAVPRRRARGDDLLQPDDLHELPGGATSRAAASGWLTRDATGRSPTSTATPASSTFFVGQVDFTTPAARRFYGDLLDEAVARRLRRLDGGLRRVHARRRPRRRRLDRRRRATTATSSTTTAPRTSTRATARRGRSLRFNRSGWRERGQALGDRLGRRPVDRLGLRRPARARCATA